MRSQERCAPFLFLLVPGLLGLALLLAWLGKPSLVIPQAAYLPIHTFLEMFAIVVSGLVFAVGWNAYGPRQPTNTVLIACAFLAVGLLDMAHTLSFHGMPDFVTPSGPEKAIDFWLSARFVDAGALLFVACSSWHALKRAFSRYFILAVTLLGTAALYTVILLHPESLPRTFIPGQGLTPFKIRAEYLIVSLHFVTAVLLWRRRGEQQLFDVQSLLTGVLIMAMSELYFTLYASVTDAYNFLGHVYKIVAYMYVYRAAFVDSVRRPHEQLQAAKEREKEAVERALQVAEEGFRAANRRLGLITEHAPIAIMAWDRDLRISRLSPAAERLFGWSIEEVRGKPFTELNVVHEDDAPMAMEVVGQLVSGQTRYATVTMRNRHRQGEVIECEWHASPAIDDDGAVLYVIAFALDVTQRRRAAEALRESQQRLKLVFDSTYDAILLHTPDGRIVDANETCLRMYGMSRDQALTATIGDISAPGADFAEVESLWLKVISGKPQLFQWKAKRVDGGEFDVEVYLRSMRERGNDFILANVRDITERKRAEQALRESEERFRATFEQAAVGIALVRLDGSVERVNARLCSITGYSEQELLARTPETLTHPDDIAADVAEAQRLVAGEVVSYSIEKRFVRKDGQFVWVNLTVALVRKDGAPHYFIAIAEDVDARKKAESQLRVAAKALENTVEGVLIANRGRIMSVNRAFSAITGYSAEEAIGRPVVSLHCIEQEELRYAERRRQIQETGFWQGEIWGRRKDGRSYPAWCSVSMIRDDDDEPLYVSVFSDISELKQQEQRLEFLAHYDELSGLPNRVLFQERIVEALTQAKRHTRVVGVLFIDLDRFKPINDTLGHDAGDELLRQVAARLKHCVRASDTVARLGGDEFAVLLNELHSPEEAGLIARNMLDVLERPFTLRGQQNYISGSIGVACFPQDGEAADTLLRHADLAMYQAKQEGRSTYRFFSAELNAQASEKLYLANSLRLALERGELILNYQPRVRLASGEVIGMEALVRWQHPERGVVLPTRFISLAEETGLIESIGEWVLREALGQLRCWREQGLAGLKMSVNLSPRQFSQASLVEGLQQLLGEFELEPESVVLEITESTMMQNPENADKVLARLAELGVGVALDDFGTGYSSLAYLKRFPVSCLKIDRAFVCGLPDDESDAALTRAVLAMARSLNLLVTAEGVESEAQYRFLRQHGCEVAQGHWFSPPLGAREAGEYLRARAGVPTAAE